MTNTPTFRATRQDLLDGEPYLLTLYQRYAVAHWLARTNDGKNRVTAVPYAWRAVLALRRRLNSGVPAGEWPAEPAALDEEHAK